MLSLRFLRAESPPALNHLPGELGAQAPPRPQPLWGVRAISRSLVNYLLGPLSGQALPKHSRRLLRAGPGTGTNVAFCDAFSKRGLSTWDVPGTGQVRGHSMSKTLCPPLPTP